MKKHIILLIGICLISLFSFDLKAQQFPSFTHYAFNKALYNPAVVGASDQIAFSASTRIQFLGYDDRTPEFWPNGGANQLLTTSNGIQSNLFSFSAPLTKYGGIGVTYLNDQLGYEFSNHFKVQAAVRLPLKHGQSIAFGPEINLLEKGIDGTQLMSLVPNPAIPNNKVSKNHPQYGFGIYYTDSLFKSSLFSNFWLSTSVLNINSSKYMFDNGVVFASPERNYFIMSGITVKNFLRNKNLKFHPSFIFTNVGISQIDFSALTEYNNSYSAGVSYRTSNDVLSMLLAYSGFKKKFKGLRIGYSFDFYLSRIQTVSSRVHELQLNFNLNSFY